MAINKSELDGTLFEGFAETYTERFIFAYNLNTHTARFSKNTCEFFGLTSEYTDTFFDIVKDHIHEDDRKRFVDDFGDMVSKRKDRLDTVYKVIDKEKNTTIVSVQGVLVSGLANNSPIFMGSIYNYGAQKSIDGITGLYNAVEFGHHMENVLKLEKRISVLFLGVGRFSEVNDTYGYSFGDLVIKKVSQALLYLVRPSGLVFKMDGMHYAFVFEDKEKSEIELIYYQMKQMLKNDIVVDNVSVSLNCCAGVILDCNNLDECIIRSAAKHALQESRKLAYGQIVYFDETLLGSNNQNVDLMREIQESALGDCSKFFLYYQPIISVKENKMIGAEALLRFCSDKWGIITPDIFIPWIETDPCFYQLGLWIIRKATTDFKDIVLEDRSFRLHLNIAYSQMSNADFKFELEEILDDVIFPEENIYLELTERCKSLDKLYLRSELEYLRERNVKVAFDGFGPNYTSFNFLSDFPVDAIKVDKEFIHDISKDIIHQAIIQALAVCCNALHIEICVEGLENEELVQFLNQYDITHYQGYYFSKPITIEEFRKIKK